MSAGCLWAREKKLHLISPLYFRGDAARTNKAVHLALATDRFDEFVKQLDADGVAYGDWQGNPESFRCAAMG